MEGFDYNETFAPKAELACHNLQSPYPTVSNKWLLHQLDVQNALLHDDPWW